MLAVSGVRAQAVAVLHDVLEDTAVTAEQLREANLSREVVDAVSVLTRRSGQTYEQYIEQVAGNAIARPVKLADLADNLANNKRLTRRPDVAARIARYEWAIHRLQAPDLASRQSQATARVRDVSSCSLSKCSACDRGSRPLAEHGLSSFRRSAVALSPEGGARGWT